MGTSSIAGSCVGIGVPTLILAHFLFQAFYVHLFLGVVWGWPWKSSSLATQIIFIQNLKCIYRERPFRESNLPYL